MPPSDDLPLPVRTELTVLPADDPEQRQIGWVVKEYSGVSVGRGPAGLTAEEILANPDTLMGFELVPITDALRVGDVVLFGGLFGGWHVCTIQEGTGGDPIAVSPSGDFVGFLAFGEDDRNCWACIGGGNLKALQRLNLGV